jgi:hypothetical protein
MANSSRRDSPYFASVTQLADAELRLSQLAHLRGLHPDIIRRMIDNVAFISNHYKNCQKKDKISDLWLVYLWFKNEKQNNEKVLFCVYLARR